MWVIDIDIQTLDVIKDDKPSLLYQFDLNALTFMLISRGVECDAGNTLSIR